MSKEKQQAETIKKLVKQRDEARAETAKLQAGNDERVNALKAEVEDLTTRLEVATRGSVTLSAQLQDANNTLAATAEVAEVAHKTVLEANARIAQLEEQLKSELVEDAKALRKRLQKKSDEIATLDTELKHTKELLNKEMKKPKLKDFIQQHEAMGNEVRVVAKPKTNGNPTPLPGEPTVQQVAAQVNEVNSEVQKGT